MENIKNILIKKAKILGKKYPKLPAYKIIELIFEDKDVLRFEEKPKTLYQKIVYSVVMAEAKKIKNKNPNYSRSQVMKEAWQTPEVKKAIAKYKKIN